MEHNSRLKPGQRLGSYEVVSRLGAGGMGEVYLAQDKTLDRPVALKVLPPALAGDSSRLRRFVHEAKSASALSHPNIATVYEMGEADGLHFIAMEYVRGEVLGQRIGGRPLTTTEVLDIAIQIADALDDAHSKNIVHRDIKPENILITPRGQVKVLDFGVAKIDLAPNPDAETAVPMTTPGMVVGTVQYMSPEQALGLEVDRRTDLFSFGVVLYQIVTGRLPFPGDTAAAVFDGILRTQPEAPAGRNASLPGELERIILKALEKDRDMRYQTAGDLRADLKRLKRQIESGAAAAAPVMTPVASARQASSRWIRVAAVIVVLAAVIAGLVWSWLASGAAPTESARAAGMVPLTSFPGTERDPAVSPDGKQIAFAWNGEKEDNFDIYVQRVDSGTPLRLTRDAAVERSPAWSPDGSQVAFIRVGKNGGVFSVPALGGPERRLTDYFLLTGGGDRILDWSPDGKHLAVADSSSPTESHSRLYLVSLETGERTVLTAGEFLGDNSPSFSPDGRHIVFVRWSGYYAGDLYITPVSGGDPVRLTFDSLLNRGPVWAPDGRSIFFSSERDGSPALWQIPASGGTPDKILEAAGRDVIPGVSRQGPQSTALLAFSQVVVDTNIWRLQATGSTGPAPAPVQWIASTRDDVSPDFSPDGRRIAFASNRSGHWEIWAADGDGSKALQLTSFRSTMVGSPRWSPDGRQIAFDARPDGNSDIFVINAQGGAPRRLTTESSTEMVPSWSGDGKWIYFSSTRGGADMHIWKIPAAGGEAVRVTSNGGFVSQESPDGAFLYYSTGLTRVTVGTGGAPFAVWRIPVGGGEPVQVIPDQLAFQRFWAVRGDGIYFTRPDDSQRPILEFIPFGARPTRIITLDKPLESFLGGLAVSSDGSILYSQVDHRNSDILLLAPRPTQR